MGLKEPTRTANVALPRLHARRTFLLPTNFGIGASQLVGGPIANLSILTAYGVRRIPAPRARIDSARIGIPSPAREVGESFKFGPIDSDLTRFIKGDSVDIELHALAPLAGR